VTVAHPAANRRAKENDISLDVVDLSDFILRTSLSIDGLCR